MISFSSRLEIYLNEEFIKWYLLFAGITSMVGIASCASHGAIQRWLQLFFYWLLRFHFWVNIITNESFCYKDFCSLFTPKTHSLEIALTIIWKSKLHLLASNHIILRLALYREVLILQASNHAFYNRWPIYLNNIRMVDLLPHFSKGKFKVRLLDATVHWFSQQSSCVKTF